MLSSKRRGQRVLRGAKHFSTVAVLVMSVMVLQGCSTKPPMYHWGRYESLIYDMYNKPGSAPPQAQIMTLTEDIEQAQAQGLKVGPGIYAHLGFMYALTGKSTLSQEAFQTEMALFPESKAFIEGMLARAAQALSAEANRAGVALIPLNNDASSATTDSNKSSKGE